MKWWTSGDASPWLPKTKAHYMYQYMAAVHKVAVVRRTVGGCGSGVAKRVWRGTYRWYRRGHACNPRRRRTQCEKKPIDLQVEDADRRRGLSRVFCIDLAGTFVCWIELCAAPTDCIACTHLLRRFLVSTSYDKITSDYLYHVFIMH